MSHIYIYMVIAFAASYLWICRVNYSPQTLLYLALWLNDLCWASQVPWHFCFCPLRHMVAHFNWNSRCLPQGVPVVAKTALFFAIWKHKSMRKTYLAVEQDNMYFTGAVFNFKNICFPLLHWSLLKMARQQQHLVTLEGVGFRNSSGFS